MQKITLSIIVPVFNEENTVAEVLLKLANLAFPAHVDKEIVVVDDGSTDGSKNIILSVKSQLKTKKVKIISHPVNLGKGAAVIDGIRNSTGDVIAIQDADLEYNPKDLVRMVTPILNGSASVVYGTRLKLYPLKIVGKKRTPLITHFFGNKLLTFVTNILYGAKVTDMETCYKMMKRSVIDGINLKSKRFELEPELTAKILKRGIGIFEIPISVSPRGYDEGKKITWKDGFVALWTLVKYRFTD